MKRLQNDETIEEFAINRHRYEGRTPMAVRGMNDTERGFVLGVVALVVFILMVW